jgi:hypothetical protein
MSVTVPLIIAKYARGTIGGIMAHRMVTMVATLMAVMCRLAEILGKIALSSPAIAGFCPIAVPIE